ncbi:MAG: tetratricopeptide repeat protein [Anaerolineae bacterium]|nr:tetratricopeptide repeat protein [Anaerolineae bacterium]
MAADPWIGRQLGAYHVQDVIGRGGMGIVYRALHTVLERYAAIKFLRADCAQDSAQDCALNTRFVREARAIAHLRHPHIVQLYDFGTCDDGYYMIQELITGESLDERIKRALGAGERLSYTEIRRIIDQIADALSHVHGQGIIHRDIKPSNILLNTEGDAFLTDFGIAQLLTEGRQTTKGIVLGTPVYIAPEQARGVAIDHRADLYALGVVLYEMLAGRPPFIADTSVALLVKHIQEPVPPLRQFVADVPPAVEQVVLKVLAKAPDRRYQNAPTFRNALQRAWETSGELGSLLTDVSSTPLVMSPPALKVTPPTTGNLPFLAVNLVGRRAEADTLKRRLTHVPACIGLVGMGGIGKTTLALAVAHELAAGGSFPDGIFWIDGREHTTLGAILAELADLLHLDLGQRTLSQQQRTIAMKLSGENVLLVVDNFETVEDPNAVAEFLRELTCAVLITSRIHPPGAGIVELLPLVPQDAVSLFQARSGLTPEASDAVVTDLCAVDLEGHPLAIEVVSALAAAGLHAAELRQYLHDMPLEVLSEVATETGRSVVDALQLSYQRLSPLAQIIFTRMSIFPADFDLTALSILSPEYTRLHQVKGLRELVERSLLTQMSHRRYRLHPVTRQFAYALLVDPVLYHRRAGAYFLTEAGADTLAAMEQLYMAGEIADAVALIPLHLDEWIDAGRASHALQQVQRFEALTLPLEMHPIVYEAQGDLFALLGQTDAAREAYDRLLADACARAYQARIHRKIGELVRRQRPAESIEWYQQALALLDDPQSLEAARIHIRLSAAWFYQGDYEQALACGITGREMAQKFAEPLEQAEAAVNLGNVYAVQGDSDRAVAAYEEALAILQQAVRRRPVMESIVLSDLASLYHDLGNWSRAVAYHEQSLSIVESLGYFDGIAITSFNLGNVYTLMGNFTSAETNLQRCLTLWQQMHSDYGVAATYMNMGQLHLRREELVEAQAALAHSRDLFETIGSEDFLPEVYCLLSEVALAQSETVLAVEYAQQSLSLALKADARIEQGMTQRVLGTALAAQGQADAALETFRQSLDLLSTLGNRYEMARTHYALGCWYLEQADLTQAAAHLYPALETFTTLGADCDVRLAKKALLQAGRHDQTAVTV